MDDRNVSSAQGVGAEMFTELSLKVDQLLLSQETPLKISTPPLCKNCAMIGHNVSFSPFNQLALKASSSTQA